MDVPEEWRPRPMIRVWGLPVAATEAELQSLIEAQGVGHAVRSVVFDPKQTTAAGRVALVRFQPPPIPEPGSGGAGAGGAAAEADTGKIAEAVIATLRAKPLELHGQKVNVEKTAAEVRRLVRMGWLLAHYQYLPAASGAGGPVWWWQLGWFASAWAAAPAVAICT